MSIDSDKVKDEELYSQFLKGDTSAYDELMVRYGDSLTFYLHGITHDFQDAEDMMIEAFAKIMVKKPGIKDGAFKAYLFKTGRNLAIRSSSRKNTIRFFSLDDLDSEPAAEEYLEGELVQDEQKRALHICMERMEPELREVVWLIYFDEMSYKQAAEVMRVSTKRVDHLLERAKKALKEELSKEGIER